MCDDSQTRWKLVTWYIGRRGEGQEEKEVRVTKEEGAELAKTLQPVKRGFERMLKHCHFRSVEKRIEGDEDYPDTLRMKARIVS